MQTKKYFFWALILLGQFVWSQSGADKIPPMEVDTYVNPIELPVADPQVGFFNGTYYLTGTQVRRYVSKNLIHWKETGLYFEPLNVPSVSGGVWAAEIFERKGKYYWYFCVPMKEANNKRQICVVTSDSPDAMFKNAAIPMWQSKDAAYIDQNIFIDDDGSAYMYVTDDTKVGGKAKIAGVRLKDNLIELDGDLKVMFEPTQDWEWSWCEGATVIKHNGVYYMTWSSQVYAIKKYSVGFATATHPLGPWVKSRHNPILKFAYLPEGLVSGPGHNGFVRSPDGKELFIVYHTHIMSNGGGSRQVAIDRTRFEADPGHPDRMVIDGPTMSPQPFPSGAAPFSQVFDRDEFLGNGLDQSRWPILWMSEPNLISTKDGALQIKPWPGDIGMKRKDRNTPWLKNVILQYAPKIPLYSLTSKVYFDAESPTSVYAFLIAWDSPRNHLMARFFQDGMVQVEKTVEGEFDLLVEKSVPSGDQIRLTQKNGKWIISRGNGAQWTPIGDPVGNFFPSGRFVKIGFGAGTTGSKQEKTPVQFDWVQVTAN